MTTDKTAPPAARDKASRQQLEERLSTAHKIVANRDLSNAASFRVLMDVLCGAVSPGYERAHDAIYGDQGWQKLGLQLLPHDGDLAS